MGNKLIIIRENREQLIITQENREQLIIIQENREQIDLARKESTGGPLKKIYEGKSSNFSQDNKSSEKWLKTV